MCGFHEILRIQRTREELVKILKYRLPVNRQYVRNRDYYKLNMLYSRSQCMADRQHPEMKGEPGADTEASAIGRGGRRGPKARSGG